MFRAFLIVPVGRRFDKTFKINLIDLFWALMCGALRRFAEILQQSSQGLSGYAALS